MEIHAPAQVQNALRLLAENGYEAFAVGGCVRDCLLGKTPADWDITTSALPQETKAVFHKYKIVETGIQHGTVTVLTPDMPLEITTYRIDGLYADLRRPETVSFSRNLRDDLARRDFTVNTLCWNEASGVIDLFGGLQDLQDHTLRTVGKADARFHEDALRILRGLRFSAVLGFTLEAETAASILQNRALLSHIAAERIREEFSKLICGKNAAAVLSAYAPVISVFIPQLQDILHCPQNTPYHCYDVFTHTLKALESIAPDEQLRLCMFLHDFGKPASHRIDANGISHFKGHEALSADLAEQILTRLRYPAKTIRNVTDLIRIHDTKAPKNKIEAKQLLSKIGEEKYRMLIQIKRADNRAKANPHAIDEKLANMERFLEEILSHNECYTLETLCINGNDLKHAGLESGAQIGQMLSTLLAAVIEEKCPNEKPALLAYAKQHADLL